jgi:hypothetical protein
MQEQIRRRSRSHLATTRRAIVHAEQADHAYAVQSRANDKQLALAKLRTVYGRERA